MVNTQIGRCYTQLYTMYKGLAIINSYTQPYICSQFAFMVTTVNTGRRSGAVAPKSNGFSYDVWRTIQNLEKPLRLSISGTS